jgi:hypothetical protein
MKMSIFKNFIHNVIRCLVFGKGRCLLILTEIISECIVKSIINNHLRTYPVVLEVMNDRI